MKILHVSDLHFHRPWFFWVANRAPEFDAVAISGDLLDLFSRTSIESQIEWVGKWLRSISVPLVVCSGNHDLDCAKRCEWLTRFSATREQLVTDRGILRRGQWTVEAVPFGKLPLRGGPSHVVVTHRPPAGAPTARLSPEGVDAGDPRLTRYLANGVEAPWLILSGDVHQPRNWRARSGGIWSFNPGAAPHAHPQVPNCIVFDLSQQTATRCDGWGRQSTVVLR